VADAPPLQEAKKLLEKFIIGTVKPGPYLHQKIVASSPYITLLCVVISLVCRKPRTFCRYSSLAQSSPAPNCIRT
jgi:hypothetical protein